MLPIICLGFLLGMRHATDVDHVFAVTTLVSRYRSAARAAIVGALWGVGHTVMVMIVGTGIILFQWVIPVRAGLGMEFSVALMLVVLGILNLTGVPGRQVEVYDHATDEFVPRPQPRLVATIRPVVVGLVHGLAGSAAIALMVLSTIHEPRLAVAYLALFGTGTLAGMMLITAALAYSFTKMPAQLLRIGSGILSLGFGLFLIYQIGIVGGLFTSHPVWSPR